MPLSKLVLPENREKKVRKIVEHSNHCIVEPNIKCNTGGPPLTRKSLPRFPLTRFLAYVRVSGGISVSRGPQ